MAILEQLRPQVQADFLQFYSGSDLDQWLQQRRYGQLLELILQLPDPDSRFYTALNQPKHEELYKLIMGDPTENLSQEGTPAEPASTPYQHVGLTELLLMELLDAQNRRRAEAAAKGTKHYPKPIKAYPRPISQRDRILNRAADAELDSLAADLGYGDELQ